MKVGTNSRFFVFPCVSERFGDAVFILTKCLSLYKNMIIYFPKRAVTRIRTWVVAATTQSTNHYTITADECDKGS